MFEKFTRSWELTKASAAVLRSDKELMIFPVISSLAALLVAATFLIPIFGLRLFEGGQIGPLGFVVGFLFYVCQYFVIFFFNVALVGAAMIRLEGGDPTVADGIRIAKSKAGVILGYAAIAATVGMVLKMFEERAGFLGRIYQMLDVRPAAYWPDNAPAAGAAELAVLHAAIRASQPVAFGYTDLDGNQTMRTVLPLALVHPPQGVKLLAWCAEREDFRQFFVRAMENPTLRPGDFGSDRMALLEGLLDKYSGRA